MNNKVSIQIQAVIYHNHKKNLLKTIEHIHNALGTVRDTVDCVDFLFGDASDAPTFSEDEVREISHRFSDRLQFRYRFFHENTGFGKGQNLLGADCNADYILIMNPDIIVTPTFFTEMLRPFNNPAVGMTEARQTPIEHHKAYDFNTLETGWASLACAMVRTELWKQLKGIDSDSFFMYCEDVDFSWRIRLLGYKIIYCPTAPVYHAKHLSNAGKWQPTHSEVYYSAESNLMMAHKWSHPKQKRALLKRYRSGDPMYREIAEKFCEREKKGLLPTPIDPHHKVAYFKDGFYADNRFIWE